MDVDLPPEMAFTNATVLMGSLDATGSRLTDPGAVGVDDLAVPGSTLYVCPADEGDADQLPPVPTLQQRCEGEDRYEDPALEVGGRTWIASRGNVSLTRPLDATIAMAWRSNATLGLAGTLPDNGTAFQLEDEAGFAFRPTRASSELLVDGEERRWYNGTGWIFYLEEADRVRLAADGFHARFQEVQPLELGQADLAAYRSANQPRLLGDLQAAARGPDEREPVENVTRLFERFARIPQLANGALLGHLGGRLDETRLPADEVSLVRVEAATLTPEGDRLTGEADVTYVRSADGFSTGPGDPEGVPWWASGLLWLGALAAIALLEPFQRPRWAGWIGAGLGLVGLAAVDLALYSVFGVSAAASLNGGLTLGEALALLGFEVIALGVAWAAFYVPARVVAERLLPSPAAAWGRSTLTLAGAILVLVWPGAIVVAGQLIARL